MSRQTRSRLDTMWSQLRTINFFSLAKPASYIPEIVNGAAQFCLERPTVDGIIFTGDLATTGLMTDLLVARSFVLDAAAEGFLTERGAPTLNASQRPIYVLPGNHDKYTNLLGTPNCVHFALQFGTLMRNYRNNVGHWVRRKENKYIGFLYADFSLQERADATDELYGVYGQGRVRPEILEELKNRSFELRNKYDGIALVWMIHFAPFDCGYGLQLNEYQSFVDSAVSLGVLATVCGHTHRAARINISGHSILCSGSTGCVDSERDSRIQVLHFDLHEDGAHVERENFVWNGDQQEFEYKGID